MVSVKLADQAVIEAVRKEFQGRQIFRVIPAADARPEAGTVTSVNYRKGKFSLEVQYSERNETVCQDDFRNYALLGW